MVEMCGNCQYGGNIVGYVNTSGFGAVSRFCIVRRRKNQCQGIICVTDTRHHRGKDCMAWKKGRLPIDQKRIVTAFLFEQRD